MFNWTIQHGILKANEPLNNPRSWHSACVIILMDFQTICATEAIATNVSTQNTCTIFLCFLFVLPCTELFCNNTIKHHDTIFKWVLGLTIFGWRLSLSSNCVSFKMNTAQFIGFTYVLVALLTNQLRRTVFLKIGTSVTSHTRNRHFVSLNVTPAQRRSNGRLLRYVFLKT